MYLTEIRLNWQSLLAASIGIAVGLSLGHYTLSLFGPPLLAEFGWSRAEFALVGSLPMVTVLFLPLAGRFTDRFGSRIAALIGFVAVPLGFLGFAFMSGSLIEFFTIYILQNIFGMLTTALVFARVVAERFDRTRGIALSILMTGPPLSGALLPPLLGEIIQEEGWRAAYMALAAISAAGGALAILLMGGKARQERKPKTELQLTRQELVGLLRHPALLLVLGGMFLVNLPQVFASSQLKLVALDRGVADMAANWLVSLYAIGVIIGRFASGLALDRIPPHIVAIYALGLPAVGLAIFATGAGAVWMLAAAVLLVGLAQGAEGDIGAYLISRRFDMKNYSLLLSFMTLMIAAGSAIGALILSFTLDATASYGPFLIIAAVATLIGAVLFLFTGRVGAGDGGLPAVSKAVNEQAAAGEVG